MLRRRLRSDDLSGERRLLFDKLILIDLGFIPLDGDGSLKSSLRALLALAGDHEFVAKGTLRDARPSAFYTGVFKKV